jgi:SAM-dependent methyltransferase
MDVPLAARVRSVFAGHSGDWNRKNRVIRKITGESERLLQLVPAYAQRDDLRFVDIGAGTGKVSRVVRKVNPDGKIYLCDAAVGMLEVARASLPVGDNHYLQTDAHRLDLSDSSVNLAAMQQVLHHLDDPADAIAEAYRVLAPGGVLLLLGLASGHQADVFPWTGQHIHTDVLGRQEVGTVERLVVDAGFHISRIYVDSFFFHFDTFGDYYSLMDSIGALERPFGYRTDVSRREKMLLVQEALNDSDSVRGNGEISIRGEYFTVVAERNA